MQNQTETSPTTMLERDSTKENRSSTTTDQNFAWIIMYQSKNYTSYNEYEKSWAKQDNFEFSFHDATEK